MWIFGYGSLVWKVDFPYTRKLVGYIEGYERRFWQASIDHRGTPDKPGRVVTLVPSTSPQAVVWGAAYKIPDNELEEVLRHLDHREVMGYEKVPILFHPVWNHPLNETKNGTVISTEKTFEVTMYYGSEQNEHFIGDAPLDQIARHIWKCVGPSGANKEYLFNLCNAMRQIATLLPAPNNDDDDEGTRKTQPPILDEHLAQLEHAVLELNKTEEKRSIKSISSPVVND